MPSNTDLNSSLHGLSLVLQLNGSFVRLPFLVDVSRGKGGKNGQATEDNCNLIDPLIRQCICVFNSLLHGANGLVGDPRYLLIRSICIGLCGREKSRYRALIPGLTSSRAHFIADDATVSVCLDSCVNGCGNGATDQPEGAQQSLAEPTAIGFNEITFPDK